MSQSTVAKIESLITEKIENYNYELVDVEFIKEGKEWFLRIYIDKPEGITLDDCEFMSKELEKLLDEKDIIKTSYILEVSSPGIERPLKKEKDFMRYIGSKVYIKTFVPVEGQKEFRGKLKDFKDGIIFLSLNTGKEYEIDFNKISSANLTVDF